VVYVPDASRAVGVAASLLSEDLREGYMNTLREEYARVRERRAGVDEARHLLPLAEARANPTPIDWRAFAPQIPNLCRSGFNPPPGGKVIRLAEENSGLPGASLLVFDDLPIGDLVGHIDWTFLFHAWQLKGRFPQILEDPAKGEEASKLFADAQLMLEQVIAHRWLRAAAVIGLFPANTLGDDIQVYADERRQRVLTTLHNLRKQGAQPRGKYNQSLADFIAPADSAQADYLGAFACTAGIGIEQKLAEFERQHDDYHAIMLKALADRLAEALAEWLHERVRREYWGYAAAESLSNEELIAERYQGIRPAIGYPACPDHSEKDLLWSLLSVEEHTGIWLTESKAMVPTAAVSGLYFSHPESRYFTVGKLGRDQISDYAARKGMTLAEAERWLAPNLAYEPQA
jgi:5-methyltetrahydrofolate--homocysteine methyltransferase